MRILLFRYVRVSGYCMVRKVGSNGARLHGFCCLCFVLASCYMVTSGVNCPGSLLLKPLCLEVGELCGQASWESGSAVYGGAGALMSLIRAGLMCSWLEQYSYVDD